MSARDFLMNGAGIFAVMALAALVELVVPLSARTPLQRGRGTANLGLTALTLALNWALTLAAASIALALSFQAPAPMARLGMPFTVQLMVGIVVLDFFFGYLAHRAMHWSPTLWKVHRVHHSDPFVEVTTSYRMHPIEVLWRFPFLIMPIWILGVPAEVVVTYRLLSALNGILEHANIQLWRPLEALSLVWVTPNMHKVHHSREAAQTDTNYGNILAIHDRLFHTFTPTDRASSVVYGLDDADPVRATSLPGLLSMPFEVGNFGDDGATAMSPARKISA